MENRMMLHRSRDHSFCRPVPGLDDTPDGQVVRLGATGGEQDLPGLGVNQGRHLFARCFHCPPAVPAEPLQRSGVAVMLP